MKKTLTTCEIADALYGDDNAAWTRPGAFALAEYLEEYEESTGEEMKLDIVAIRCDFSEFGGFDCWVEEYFGRDREGKILAPDEILEAYNDHDWDAVRDYITDRGQLVEFDGGIIVSSF